jgi:hypothetical protein
MHSLQGWHVESRVYRLGDNNGLIEAHRDTGVTGEPAL